MSKLFETPGLILPSSGAYSHFNPALASNTNLKNQKTYKGIVEILLGAGFAGKGRFIKLSSEDNAAVIGTGGYCRELAAKDNSFAVKLQEIMEKGELAPDHLVNGYVSGQHATFVDVMGCNRIKYDGYPRNRAQVEHLENNVLCGEYLTVVINFDLSRKELRRRAIEQARKQCKNPGCNAEVDYVYDICPHCGAETFVRPDDNPVTQEYRWDLYDNVTYPAVMDNFKADMIIDYHGQEEAEMVRKRINNFIAKKKIIHERSCLAV